MPFRHLYWLFGLFIIGCGLTHFMAFVTAYDPVYRLDGLIKLVTALASWGTVAALFEVAPKALAMRMPEELEREIAARRVAEAALQLTNEQLEERVRERTTEIEQANRALQAEVDERVRAQQALQERVSEIETLMDVLPVAVWVAHDRACARITGNATGYALLRMPAESNLSLTAAPNERPSTFRVRRNGEELPDAELPLQYAAATGEEVRDADIELVFADGAIRYVTGNARPLLAHDGTVRGAVATFSDITDRRRARMELEALNNRLQRAMRETHHRVKNNLQLICAMLDLHSAESAGALNPHQVRQLGQHVRALSTIHDILTRHAGGDIDLDEVSLKETMDSLLAILAVMAEPRKVTAEVVDVSLSVRTTTAIALALNELVSNAVNHGEGDIVIRFTATSSTGSLTVADMGAGFPAGFDVESNANTGLQLVEQVVQWDLHGHVSYRNRPSGGGEVEITFPLEAAIVRA